MATEFMCQAEWATRSSPVSALRPRWHRSLCLGGTQKASFWRSNEQKQRAFKNLLSNRQESRDLVNTEATRLLGWRATINSLLLPCSKSAKTWFKGWLKINLLLRHASCSEPELASLPLFQSRKTNDNCGSSPRGRAQPHLNKWRLSASLRWKKQSRTTSRRNVQQVRMAGAPTTS